MLLHDLFEAVGGNILYHGCYADGAAAILLHDKVEGRTPHNARRVPGARPSDVNQFEDIYGVSLTRDVRFARAWRSGGGIVIGFDGDRLRQRHRFQTMDYYGNRREAEEFLVGSIIPASRYIVSISASADTAEEMSEQDECWGYDEILNHPLFRVDGQKWHPTTGVATKGEGVPQR